ncbi:hypothetical protein dsx2_1373 [Desulfovibrio sp. X2]|uniref:hypothetical protein n=1 Tax=Desulfovibrio sp. X2 TaxID=941449 RepID=UPI000358F0B4|nr:hypothetical protein [Desulfovibrio sp. X2]EPR44745.1 hypothetical protein dsx2_1373 [Desulfovibrio sp. X2]
MSKSKKPAAPLKQAVVDAAQVMRFDHWMRFYFLKEKDGKLVYEVPAEAVAEVQANHSHLEGLLDMVNERETDQERSTTAVCSFIAARLDGMVYKEGTISEVFDSPAFKIEMYLFSLWNQSHEAMLDENPVDFTEWERLYAEWRESSQVKEYEAKLVSSPAQRRSDSTQ